MKNNIIMNINKLQLTIIGILSLIIILPGQVKADDSYVQTIREDRVWEYFSYAPYSYGPSYYTFKFDGTVTVNDKVFHAFSNINYKYFDRVFNDDYTYTDIPVSDIDLDGKGEKYFLREADGKVYILVYNSEDSGDYITYVTHEKLSDLSFGSEDKLTEKVLYDSSLDDSNPIYLSLYYGFTITTEEVGLCNPSIECLQNYGDSVEIDNQLCRTVQYYTIENSEYDIPSYILNEYIEGIGVQSRGILSNFCSYYLTGSAPEKLPEKSTVRDIDTYYSRLRSVYSTDGRVLYGEEPISGVERTEAETLTVGAADGAVTARGAGNIEMTVCGLDGVCVASASGDCEVTIPTVAIGRGLYIVTASDGARTRTLKLRH